MSETHIQKVNDSALASYSSEELDLIKKTVAMNTTDDELKLFMYTSERTGLNPLTRQIHCIKMNRYNPESGKTESVMNIVTGIDGFRVVAERSGKYAGQTRIEYGQMKDGYPEYAEVGVFRKDWEQPVYARAYWKEYAKMYKDKNTQKMKVGGTWEKMPFLMLGKCAEALALRKAFPQDLSGVYTTDEMEQGDRTPLKVEHTDVTPPQQPKTAPPMAKPPVIEDIQREKQMRTDIVKYLQKFGVSKDSPKEIFAQEVKRLTDLELVPANFEEILCRLEIKIKEMEGVQ
jgi:phage recombination protein Bet